jgi:phage terminase large subunit-like protein
MNWAEKYINDVLSGETVVGEYARLAVERHVKDLETGIDRGLYFDKKAANKAMRWFTFLRHSKGRDFVGQKFELAPWQAFIVYSIFGWMRSNGTRRFRKAYISVAKKNGKTTFAAGIALYMIKADGEPRAEAYAGASKYSQAKICFDEAKAMISSSPGLSEYFTAFSQSIYDELTGSYFQPLASDNERQDGLNPHFALIDEYHAHKSNALVDNLQSGMVNRSQPLIMMITTAGFNRNCPCYNEEKTCKNILQGILEQDDKFAIIFSMDENDDWEDPVNWQKANPNLNISLSLESLEDEYKEVLNNNHKLNNFLTKNLNLWVDSATGFIKLADWRECNKPIDVETLRGRRCFGGLDLAAHEDFNCFSLDFEMEDGEHVLLMFSWIPEFKTTIKRDRVDYRLWKKQGWIITTPGNVIDINQQINDILEIVRIYDVQSIAFDPARAYHGVVQGLQANDIKMSEFRQTTMALDSPTRELEKLVLSRKLNHLGNPVLAWMISNVEIMEDSSGNIKPSKGRSSEKIDGVLSTVMAIGERMTFGTNTYNYLS